MIDLDVRTVLCASTLCLAGPAMASPCASDLNHDGTTDGRDLAMVLAAWNTADHFSDVNGDGLSNGIDLALVLNSWGDCGNSSGSITSVSPHFVAPGSAFVVFGVDPTKITEVLLDGESIDFDSDSEFLSAKVPENSTEGARTLVLVTANEVHRVVNGITVSEELGGNLTTYVPTFSNEGAVCDGPADTASGLVNFEGKGGPNRSCSNQGYTGITSVTADIDLSDCKDRICNNASFYMISNPTNPSLQPLGDSNYCDRGSPPKNPQFKCREIDFLETNGGAITQTTEHLSNIPPAGGGDPGFGQRWEESWTEEAASSSCFTPSPAPGGHDITSFNLDQPIRMVATFDTSATGGTNGTTPPTRMTVTFAQGGNTITVYDSQGVPMGQQGSIDSSDLTTQLAGGFWLLASYHQDYCPNGPNYSWVGQCGYSDNCGPTTETKYGWKLSNISVVGNGTIGD